MSFPFHDRYWTDTANFVEKHRATAESLLAPDLFWWRFERIARYSNTKLRAGERYDWAILRKGELDRLATGFLPAVRAEMRPVFANEVFVVWTRRGGLPPVAETDPHLAAYYAFAARAVPAAAPRDPPAGPPPIDHALPDVGAIARLDAMTPRAFRETMDAFHRKGGYRYETLRDKAFSAEIDRCTGLLLRTGPETRLLDIACGTGRVVSHVPAGRCRELVGVDISSVAVAQARERWADRPECGFAVMDASRLAFPDAAFDAVAFVDAAEHILDIESAIAEAARVLRPGGGFVITAANRNSLNQIITRKLGYPEFLTNYQHVREFTLEEFEALLAKHRLAVTEGMGILLFPYWGIPAVDGVVRKITDDDPEVVEILREMGEQVGPRHSYAFALGARKER